MHPKAGVFPTHPGLLKAEWLLLDHHLTRALEPAEEAEQLLTVTLRAEPQHTYGWLLLSHIQRGRGDPGAAQRSLERVPDARRHLSARWFEGSTEALAPYLVLNLQTACTRGWVEPELAPRCGSLPAVEAPADAQVYEQISWRAHGLDRVRQWAPGSGLHTAEDLLNRVGLRPGMSAADLGAGEGWFTLPMARVVGSEGRVFATEISQPYLDFIKFGAGFHGLNNVTALLAPLDASGLPTDAIDLVLVCEVFKAFYNNRLAADPAHVQANMLPYLRSIHQALRPQGSLVIIEHASSTTDPDALSAEFLRRDAEAVGFGFVEVVPELLPAKSVLILKKID